VVWEVPLCDSCSFQFAEAALCPECDSSWWMSCGWLRTVCILLLLDGMIYNFNYTKWLIVLVRLALCLQIFCWLDLSITNRKLLKFLTLIVIYLFLHLVWAWACLRLLHFLGELIHLSLCSAPLSLNLFLALKYVVWSSYSPSSILLIRVSTIYHLSIFLLPFTSNLSVFIIKVGFL
jgi:hypothetical protein